MDSTDNDVDSLARSTKLTFRIFLGAVWELILCAKQSLQSDTFTCNVRTVGALMPSNVSDCELCFAHKISSQTIGCPKKTWTV